MRIALWLVGATMAYNAVEAAVALGQRDGRILSFHILANALPPLIVQATFVCALAIILEATLSFLGIGTPPEVPSWGNIMGDARVLIREAPWLMFFPGACIMFSVLSLNLLGDGLRDLVDPQRRT